MKTSSTLKPKYKTAREIAEEKEIELIRGNIDEIKQRIDQTTRLNNLKKSELEGLRSSNILRAAELETRDQIITEKKKQMDGLGLIRRRKAQVDFARAQSTMQNQSDFNEKLKSQINSIYDDISQLTIPQQKFSEADFTVINKTINFLLESNQKRSLFLLHFEELLTYINKKINEYKIVEDASNLEANELLRQRQQQGSRRNQALITLTNTVPANIENEYTVKELENEIQLLSESLKESIVDNANMEYNTMEKVLTTKIIDENERLKVWIEKTKEYIKNENENYVSPNYEVHKYDLSPKKPITEEIEYITEEKPKEDLQIIDEIKKHLEEMQKANQETEKVTDQMQKEFLEKRDEIEKTYFEKMQKIRSLSKQINNLENIQLQILHFQAINDDDKERIKDIDNYLKRSQRIRSTSSMLMSNSTVNNSSSIDTSNMSLYEIKQLKKDNTMPPISTLSPIKSTKAIHSNQKARQIEINNNNISVIKDHIKTLEEQIKQKEEEISQLEKELILD